MKDDGLEVDLFGGCADECMNFANTDCDGCHVIKGKECLGLACEFYEIRRDMEGYKETYAVFPARFGSRLEPNFDLTSFRFA